MWLVLPVLEDQKFEAFIVITIVIMVGAVRGVPCSVMGKAGTIVQCVAHTGSGS